MKIYLAGSSHPSQMERVERWAAALGKVGISDGRRQPEPAWQVTSTWIANVRAVGAGNPRDASAIARRGWAVQDLQEVRQSEVFWFLVPPPDITTLGAWCEIATAYESARPIVCSGDAEGRHRSIFTALGQEFDHDEQAFDWLNGLRRSDGR